MSSTSKPTNLQRQRGASLHPTLAAKFAASLPDEVDMPLYECPDPECGRPIIRGHFPSGTTFEVECRECRTRILHQGGKELLKRLTGGKNKVYRRFEFQ